MAAAPMTQPSSLVSPFLVDANGGEGAASTDNSRVNRQPSEMPRRADSGSGSSRQRARSVDVNGLPQAESQQACPLAATPRSSAAMPRHSPLRLSCAPRLSGEHPHLHPHPHPNFTPSWPTFPPAAPVTHSGIVLALNPKPPLHVP